MFQRSLGEGSDVVMHEMFRFSDLGGSMVALRPEGTVSVVRAVASRKAAMPQRYFYSGPMYRYERPQV